jgi:Ni/Co efflux regulator RcnB
MAKQNRIESGAPSRMKRFGMLRAVACVSALASLMAGAMPAAAAVAAAAPQEKKDYLTDSEADRVRDAETPNDRVKLYISYASDRLKKFQYELSRTVPERKRAETLNGLLNAYSGCVDDAADLLSLEIDKGADIRDALKEMVTQGKDFLAALDKIQQAGGPELDIYKDTLDDAIEGTQDAVKEAETAQKNYTPPVRRKPA